MTETTERFLHEIATRVGYDRVAELYLFPVLRQGGVEGAVAVVAAYPEPVEGAAPESIPESQHDAQVDGEEPAPGESEPTAGAEITADEAANDAAPQDGQDDHASESADASASPEENPSPVADSAGDVPVHVSRPERARHVVYTARYRHTIKGTDRGRWMVEVVAEADAPLVTVEEVVRGVVRRSGEAFQPERISGDQFRAIVPAPAVPGSAPA